MGKSRGTKNSASNDEKKKEQPRGILIEISTSIYD